MQASHNTLSSDASELRKDAITFVLPADAAVDLEHVIVQAALSVLKTASFGYLPLLEERRRAPTVVNMKRCATNSRWSIALTFGRERGTECETSCSV